MNKQSSDSSKMFAMGAGAVALGFLIDRLSRSVSVENVGRLARLVVDFREVWNNPKTGGVPKNEVVETKPPSNLYPQIDMDLEPPAYNFPHSRPVASPYANLYPSPQPITNDLEDFEDDRELQEAMRMGMPFIPMNEMEA
jgi:hypothetical protein